MNLSKKCICIALAALTAGSSLCGCSEKTSKESGNVTTVTVWSGNTHSKEVETEYINNWNNSVGKEKGIKIDFLVKDSSTYSQAVDLAVQSGEAPDFFSTSSVAKLVENDDIVAINDLPGGEEFLKKYNDSGLGREKVNTYNGKWYCVPVSASVQGIIYNKDMFKKAGIVDGKGNAKPPETWEEVRADAKKLTDLKKKQYGIIFPGKWDGWYQSDIGSQMMASVGHPGFNPATGKYDYSVLAPITETVLGIKEDKSMYPGVDGLDNDPARALFAEGNIGMKFGFSFDYGVLTDQFQAKCDWGVAPCPVVDKNNKYRQIMDYGNSMVINKKSLKKISGEVLMEVFKVISGDDYVRTMYEKGMAIPYDFDIVRDIKVKDGMKQWKEFAALVDISAWYPRSPQKDSVIFKNPGTVFTEKVWLGKISPKDYAKEVTDAANEAVKAYYDAHPDEDLNEFIIKDWNIKR